MGLHEIVGNALTQEKTILHRVGDGGQFRFIYTTKEGGCRIGVLSG